MAAARLILFVGARATAGALSVQRADRTSWRYAKRPRRGPAPVCPSSRRGPAPPPPPAPDTRYRGPVIATPRQPFIPMLTGDGRTVSGLQASDPGPDANNAARAAHVRTRPVTYAPTREGFQSRRRRRDGLPRVRTCSSRRDLRRLLPAHRRRVLVAHPVCDGATRSRSQDRAQRRQVNTNEVDDPSAAPTRRVPRRGRSDEAPDYGEVLPIS